MGRSSGPSDPVDEAEGMRREGRIQEALESVEKFLQERPDHPRGLLLRSRLLYELGKHPQALEGLREAAEIMGEDRELHSIVAALEQLGDGAKLWRVPAFATESMAGLLAQQGYFLEAMEIYRQLFQAAEERSDLWDEIARLRACAEREGSRGATLERVAREVEAWERWFKEHRRGP